MLTLFSWLVPDVLSLILRRTHAVLLLLLFTLVVLRRRVWLDVVWRILFADPLALPLEVFIDHD